MPNRRLLCTTAGLLAAIVVVAAAGCRSNRQLDEDSTQPVPGPKVLSSAIDVNPAYATAQLPGDPDDPAIWVHPTDPSRSLIIGTLKAPAPAGAIVVYGLDGPILQMLPGVDRPNNVDVEYGFRLGRKTIDIAVATERLARQLRIFRIDPDTRRLIDLGGAPILRSEPGEGGAPMGIGLYRRPRDGAVFAIVAPKAGPRDGYLWQYRLSENGGRVTATFVRRLGRFSATTVRAENEIEAVAIDDELGYVYYADEADGIHKWHADPDHPDAGQELAHFGRGGFRGDREGIAIYAASEDGTGYIVCTDQLDRNSEYHVYPREGAPGNPHDHSREIAVIRGGADATDGLEISSRSLGPGFPRGVMVAMNSGPRNFLLFRWEDVAAGIRSRLDGKGNANRP